MKALALFLLFLSSISSADDTNRESSAVPTEQRSTEYERFASRSIGHNLSANNYTLRKSQWSLGTLYAAYGLAENLSIGVSPFVFLQFGMMNLMARYAIPISSKEKIGFDVAYFKTSGGNSIDRESCTRDENSMNITCKQVAYRDRFMMEAFTIKATYSRVITDFYRFNSTLSYFYYLDERMPFSFRMDPANSDPFALNLTSLHEFKINKFIFINLEGGLWGLNYEYPYYHTGLTINLQTESVLVGAGVSTTFSPSFPREDAREFVNYDSRYSVHPEVQIQFFF